MRYNGEECSLCIIIAMIVEIVAAMMSISSAVTEAIDGGYTFPLRLL